MSSSSCCFLTCIQISQEAGQVIWHSHLFQNFPQFLVIHTVKGFGNKAEIDVFLELSCLFDDPAEVGKLISGSSAFSKFSLNIWKLSVHVLLKAGLENSEHYFTSMWDECNCAAVWAFFGFAFLMATHSSILTWKIPCMEEPVRLQFMVWQRIRHDWATSLLLSLLLFLGIGMNTYLFQSCGHCWVFQIYWHIMGSTLTASSFRFWNSSVGIPSSPLALFVVMLPKALLTSHSRMSGSRWVITPSW